MREYRFDPSGELPVIRVALRGSKSEKKATCVLDTGCSFTQVHFEILEMIGCGQDRRLKDVTIAGVTGESDSAFVSSVDSMKLFGNRLERVEIAGVDFSKWAKSDIEGLIGWDIIRAFHLEMIGPEGILKVI